MPADKNPVVVAAVRHSGDTYTQVFCANGDVYCLTVDPVLGTTVSEFLMNVFPVEPEPQAKEGMRPYWNEMTTPRSGMAVKEVHVEADNVYVKDKQNRVWQLVIGYDVPEIRLVAHEDH